MSRPFAIVTASTCETEEDCSKLRRLAEYCDLVVVKDENLEATIQMVKDMRAKNTNELD